MLMVLAILACACQAPASPTSPRASAVPELTAGAMAAAAAGLPNSPEGAATALVDRILTSDVSTSNAATAELLRREGLPLIHADGSIFALPDKIVVIDQPVYVELVPQLARALRQERAYSTDQVAAILNSGAPQATPVFGEVVIDLLRNWGKESDAPEPARYAGAAARAFAAHREELYFLGLQSADVDPLTTIVLIAHLVGADYPRNAPASTGPAAAQLLAFHDIDSICAQLKTAIGGYKVGTLPGKVLWKSLDKALGGELGKAMTAAGEAVLAGWKDISAAIGTVVDVVQVLASLILYLLAMTIDISSQDGFATHFRHASGDHSKDLRLMAKVQFDPALPGSAKGNFSCAQLTGITMPAHGNVEAHSSSGGPSEWRVRWWIDTDEHRTEVLRANPTDQHKIDDQYPPMDADGISRLTVYPRTEAQPGQGAVHTSHVVVKASVEHLISEGAFFTKLIGWVMSPTKIIKDAAQFLVDKIGLPSARETMTVKYHAPDIYRIQDSSPSFNLVLANLPLMVDVVSCSGIAGPWQGKGGAVIEANQWTDVLAKLAGTASPGTHDSIQSVQFTLDPAQKTSPEIPLTDWGLRLQVTLDRLPKPGEHVDGPIGVSHILFRDQDLEPIAQKVGGANGSTVYDVVGSDIDTRCPGTSAINDPFDPS